MELLIAFIALTLLGIAAQAFAFDSRDGFFSQPRSDLRDLPSQHS